MAHELVGVLFRGTLVATAAIVLVLALRPATYRLLGARAAYRLWLIVAFAIVATWLPAPARSLAPVSWTFAPDMANAPLTVAVPATAPAIDPMAVLIGAWLSGVLVALTLFAQQQRRYLRDLGRLARIDARTLRAANSRHSPALIGALRPRIVLPGDFESRYDARERELVLAHERVHLARGDAQINALVIALRCLQWFNPMMHFAAMRFRFDQELACDAAVITRFPEARRCYADVMLKTQLAGQAWQEPRLPVGCQWPSGHPLKARIAMLKKPLPGSAKTALGLVLTAALIGAGSLAAWAAQPQSGAAGVAAKTTTTPAGYRSISRINYPQKTAVAGDCVVIATLQTDVHGAITNLLSLTIHGSTPHDVCRRWGSQAASTIMAKWRFEPAQENGKPVASRAIVPIVFTAHANDFFDASPIPADALDAIRISALPNVSMIAPSADSVVPKIAGAGNKATLELRSIEGSMPWKFSLGREDEEAEGDGC